MSKIKSVKFNFIMNFILTASQIVFPLLTFPYVSRVLEASGNGKVAFIASAANCFSMVASLGIPTYGIRVCATVRDDREKLSQTVWELMIIHSISTIIAIALFFASYLFIDEFRREPELMLIYGISLPLNVLGVNWLYSALEQYQYITIRSLLFKVLSVILMFVLVRKRADYIFYGAILVFAVAGSNILNFINMRKYVDMRRPRKYDLKRHMKPILMFFAQTVAVAIYTNMDTVMLGFMKNDVEVGLYAVGLRVKNLLGALVTSLGTVLLPRLSYYTANGYREEFEKLIHKAVDIVFVISMTISVYFVIMAEDCILLLSGEDFLGATLAMQIIIPTIVFIGLSNIIGIQVLTPLNKEKYLVVSVIVGAAVEVVLNAVFIPKMGAAGASVGMLATEVAVLGVVWYVIKSKIHMKLVDACQFTKIIVITLIAGALLWVTDTMFSYPPFVQLVITSAVYFGAVAILLVLLRVNIVGDILGRRKKHEI